MMMLKAPKRNIMYNKVMQGWKLEHLLVREQILYFEIKLLLSWQARCINIKINCHNIEQ